MSILDKVRKWIDGDTAELVLEQAARDAQIKPRSKAEEFIVEIARKVEAVMQSEMVPLPQGSTIIPSEYTIFLSNDDDKDWQGIKRRGLEQGLYHILAERAKEIAGKKKLETRSFVIELRIDGSLEQGNVRVQHSWEDPESGKTGVLKRPAGLPPIAPAMPPVQKTAQDAVSKKTSPDNAIPADLSTRISRSDIRRAEPISGEDAEEMTHVASRAAELYRLEVWHHGIRQSVIPVFQAEVTVGRGSRSRPVDIPLSGDVEISRRHLTLGTDGNGTFWVTNEGRNPAMIENYELPSEQRVKVTPGMSIKICSYLLRIQPQ